MIDIEELKRLEAVATEGRWHIVLGSGNCQCTAIHAEYDNGEGTMIFFRRNATLEKLTSTTCD